mgnify:CR=1 FL=1
MMLVARRTTATMIATIPRVPEIIFVKYNAPSARANNARIILSVEPILHFIFLSSFLFKIRCALAGKRFETTLKIVANARLVLAQKPNLSYFEIGNNLEGMFNTKDNRL